MKEDKVTGEQVNELIKNEQVVETLGKGVQDHEENVLGFELSKEEHEDGMEEKKAIYDYKVIYEKAIKAREKHYVIPGRITDFTADKRRFGLNKYGAFSFQISFENSIACLINEHIKGEITDLINYINHRDLMRDFKGLKPLDSTKVITILVNLFEEADELSDKEWTYESKD